MQAKSSPSRGARASSTLALPLAATGVVFGDIGTSPLYALRACFSDIAGMSVDALSVLGILSLIFWSLLLVISVKYVGIVLRADNNGEGGVLALTTRLLNEQPLLSPAVVGTLGLIGCALFYGDGVITPAVTVLGALEGVSIAAPAFETAVLTLSIIALLWLFIERTGIGARIKAGAFDVELVRALGINLPRLRLLVFALGIALAAFAGIVMAPIWGIRPQVGVDAVVPAFLIIVLGGVGSLWGAVIAGLLVGIVVGLTGAFAGDWAIVSMYLLFIAVVTFRARGLFGRKSVLDV